jgi:AP-1 complex subunit mu
MFTILIYSFQRKVLELEEVNMKPVFSVSNVHYAWIKHRNIYIVAVAKRNPNLTLIFSFLYKVVEILIDYFNQLEEESIRDNFVLIYELLDEVIDHGYPQTTETKILKEYIKTESYKIKADRERGSRPATNTPQDQGTNYTTNKISWRPEGIKYRLNQAFLDVVEKVNSLISNKGVMLRSEIVGHINMKSCLSGMPTLKLGLNDKIFFELSGRSKN